MSGSRLVDAAGRLVCLTDCISLCPVRCTAGQEGDLECRAGLETQARAALVAALAIFIHWRICIAVGLPGSRHAILAPLIEQSLSLLALARCRWNDLE